MKSAIAYAAVLAQLAAAQDFNFADVLNAPSPSLTQAPLTAAASNATSVYSLATSSVAASIQASVVTAATTASITGSAASAASTQTPTITAAPSALGQRDLSKRDLWAALMSLLYPPAKTTSTTTAKTTSTSSVKTTSSVWGSTSSTAKLSSTSSAAVSSSSVSSSSSSSVPVTSSASTTTSQQSTTSTTSSTSACPTVPEAGTYCGFINPEDPCAPQPDGYGPKVQPDTAAAFQSYPAFQQTALNAPTPSSYALTFQNYNFSTSANSYLGLYTLQSYDTNFCAAKCDNTTLCTAFNIYIERDPALNPTYNMTWDVDNNTYSCPNPSSLTNYKCTLWGSNIDGSSATNGGGWRDDFQVVIVGSNGYDKTNNTVPAPVPGYNPPTNCSSGGAVSAGGNYWLGSNFFPGPFDPSVCGIYAQAQASKNKAASIAQGVHSYTPCNMFNAYAVHKNGVPQGTYCSLYNTVLTSQWAAFKGAWSGQNYFGVRNSWTYSLSNLDTGKC